jgi:hypothetical protein
MRIREVISNVKNWIKGKLIHDTILDEYFEEWCEDRGFLSDDEDELYEYIDELTEELYGMFKINEGYNPNGSFLAEGFQVDFDDMMDEVMEYAEGDWDDEDKFGFSKNLAHSLDNPFANTDGYMWIPICEAVETLLGNDARKLAGIEGTVGQKIMLGFLMQGNDGGLDPIYVYHSF